MEKHIQTPITEEVTADLKSGDYVYITGTMYVADGCRNQEEILIATFDLDEIAKNRLSWGIFRDRRPECYEEIGLNSI